MMKRSLYYSSQSNVAIGNLVLPPQNKGSELKCLFNLSDLFQSYLAQKL